MAKGADRSTKEDSQEKAKSSATNKPAATVKPGPTKPSQCASSLPYDELLASCLNLVSSSVQSKDPRFTSRALRCLRQLRKKREIRVLVQFIQTLRDSQIQSPETSDQCQPAAGRGVSFTGILLGDDLLQKASDSLKPHIEPVDVVMDDSTIELPDTSPNNAEMPATLSLLFSDPQLWDANPEVETFLIMLTIITHIEENRYSKAVELSAQLVKQLMLINRRTSDYLAARAFFYYYLAHEKTGNLGGIRLSLLSGFRVASLHNDAMTQATLLNLILRNYLHFNLYGLALKLVSKTSYPESLRSSTQYIRYLFYIGRLQAMQLEYSEAHSRIMQALRKAPQAGPVGRGFRLIATKMAIVVELLMGDIPDRQIFNQKDIKEDLLPYQRIVQAVRGGDVNTFKTVMTEHADLFERDRTLSLIRRLHHSVIRAGLRMITAAFSRISLDDVAAKLGLETPLDAEYIVSKAILDNVIEATIDADQKFVESKPRTDLYSSTEPTKAFHKRIAFCLQLHSDAVKAMQYPEDTEYKAGEDDARKKRLQDDIADARESDVMDFL